MADESNGKQDYKEPPAGYSLVNINVASDIAIGNANITIGISVRNLFNARYRDYLNSMRYFTDEMGRNVGFRIKFPLNQAHH